MCRRSYSPPQLDHHSQMESEEHIPVHAILKRQLNRWPILDSWPLGTRSLRYKSTKICPVEPNHSRNACEHAAVRALRDYHRSEVFFDADPRPCSAMLSAECYRRFRSLLPWMQWIVGAEPGPALDCNGKTSVNVKEKSNTETPKRDFLSLRNQLHVIGGTSFLRARPKEKTTLHGKWAGAWCVDAHG